MKNIVLFDFFGVISSEIAPIWFRKHFSDEEADKIKSKIVSLADVGLISENETYQKISELMGISAEQIAKQWQELVYINQELVSIIKSLKEKYKVYLLSNAIGPFLTRILEKYDLYSLFDKVYISSELKLAKPNKEFFEYVLHDNKIDPKCAVMIDDNAKNLEGASLCGIDGILFTSNNDFKQKFDYFFGEK